MKSLVRIIAVFLVAWMAPGARAASAQAPPDSTDRALLQVVDAALQTAAQTPAPWPGYDAASRALVVYRPGRWRILINPPAGAPVEGWTRLSPPWPALPRPAWLDADGDPSLVGQLGFDYDAPGGLVVAIPLYENLGPQYGRADLFAFVVHEAFHQFQRHRFADVNTPSDEAYPTLDPENNALAALEFLALRDAVAALARGDDDGARERARTAVAVHAARVARLDDDARTIERSQEVVEGTAKYVETRFVAGFAALCHKGVDAPIASLCPAFNGLDAPTWLANDFNRRLTGGAIAPADMARNRIYPVAASVALLLDVVEPGWKATVEHDGTSRGLFDHLDAALKVSGADRPALVAKAKEHYHWSDLLASSRARVEEYVAGFKKTMAAFNAEPGVRLSVSLPASGVSRSRSSREQRWVVDAGRRVLGRFVVYTLRRSDPALELSIENLVVLDEMGDDGRRTVTVHVPKTVAVTTDGEALSPDAAGAHGFRNVSVKAAGATLRASLPGTVTLAPGRVEIDLQPSGK